MFTMKKILFSLFFAFISFPGWGQENFHFTIKGQLPDSCDDGSYMYLALESAENLADISIEKPIWERTYVDSAVINDGRFIFNRTSSKKGELYVLESRNKKNTSWWVVGEPGEINVVFRKMNERVTCSYVNGTPLNDQLTDEILVPYGILAFKIDSVIAERGINASHKYIAPYFDETYTCFSKFVKTHINYPVGECFLILFCPLKEEDKNEIFSHSSEYVRKLYEKKMATMFRVPPFPDSVKVGRNLVDFTLPTLAGNPLTLSEVVKEKKLVILDFWASWCGPCLHEMPELVALYETYKDKDLEIIGISLDGETEPWEEAIKKNKMSWPQIINQKVGEKNLSEVYGVTMIPHAILIDQSGKIISRGLRGKQLSEAVKQLIK